MEKVPQPIRAAFTLSTTGWIAEPHVMHPERVVVVGEVGDVGLKTATAVVPNHVVGDRRGLRDDLLTIGDDRRPPERMDRFQFLRRAVCLGVALVELDVVRQPQLLEQPKDALRPRVVQEVHHDHRGSPFAVVRAVPRDLLEAFADPPA
jgi:hypothetical protein